jgi:hypothetical protein
MQEKSEKQRAVWPKGEKNVILNLKGTRPDMSLNRLDGYCQVSIQQGSVCSDARIGLSGHSTLKKLEL